MHHSHIIHPRTIHGPPPSFSALVALGFASTFTTSGGRAVVSLLAGLLLSSA